MTVPLSPQMSRRLSPWGRYCLWPRNRPWDEEERAAFAAASDRRKRWLTKIEEDAKAQRLDPSGRRRKSAKSPQQYAIETDAHLRAAMFLSSEEEKENAKFLRENNRVRLPETDEDAAAAQREQQKSSIDSDQQLAAAIDQANGVATMSWHGEIVGDRLIEAYRTLELLPLSTLPASFKNSMPAIIRDDTDRKGEQEQREKHDRERNRVRLTASSHEIFRMEQAFLWPIHLLKKEKFRRIVFLWAQWRGQRKNLRTMCKQRGFDYSTFMRRREIAVLAIAYELNKASVPVVISEKMGMRARRRRKLRNTTASTKKKTQSRAVIRGEVIDFS